MVSNENGEFLRIKASLEKFVESDCIPAEIVYEQQLNDIAVNMGSRWAAVPDIMNQLKMKAKSLELWNLFMAGKLFGKHVCVASYAQLSEIMGRSFLAPEACNCSAPDTGNMEVLEHFGTPYQKEKWLAPLLSGEIRSAFLMTEPEVASSDALNISCSIQMDGEEWKDKNLYSKHSMILVPSKSEGITVVRSMQVFGYDHAPSGHAEIILNNVRVPISKALIAAEGQGFFIAQSRLGPGRVHHCMRAIGMAERALTALIQRSRERVVFRKKLIEYDTVRTIISQSRLEIDQARLLVLHCARKLDKEGSERSLKEIAMIKICVPRVVCDVIDKAIQVHGGMGVSQDTFLAYAYANMRTLRIADGPDEVHIRSLARLELKMKMEDRAGYQGYHASKLLSKL